MFERAQPIVDRLAGMSDGETHQRGRACLGDDLVAQGRADVAAQFPRQGIELGAVGGAGFIRDRDEALDQDIGSWVAYPYAHAYEDELAGVVFLDANIPGVTLQPVIRLADPDYWRGFHFLFNMIEDLPEALLAGRERILIEWFFNHKTANAMATFDAADIDEYERVYSRLGGMRGMLGYYRAVMQDMKQNEILFSRKLDLAVLALGGDQGSAPDIFSAMQPLGTNVRGGVVEKSGHYIPEEQPHRLAEMLP
ncbi:hypothetical protein MPEAHAMD_7189 [Methylobacterium frigidaeris]|uniref:Uncharacterized protein n=1 Tax=Methylobacterium frigidaeris TaxID=2038277 RepID=A0AA37HKU3_9HYPH|nr:hypothetical protein MPEAHAMD_7189 [Methylobacterium frigidaeris]